MKHTKLAYSVAFALQCDSLTKLLSSLIHMHSCCLHIVLDTINDLSLKREGGREVEWRGGRREVEWRGRREEG